MQEVISSFTTVMTWLVLGFASIVVVLMGLGGMASARASLLCPGWGPQHGTRNGAQKTPGPADQASRRSMDDLIVIVSHH